MSFLLPDAETGRLNDNLEIVTENGQRFSFFRKYSKPMNLKDLKINRWSKIKFVISHCSLNAMV